MRLRLHPSAYVLAVATTALHLAVCHRFGYYRDELYFIDCAKHLAWGYVDQPPLAPFVTWLTAPLGYPVWGLRFFPAILSGVTVLYGCAIARELRSRLWPILAAGRCAPIICQVLPLAQAAQAHQLMESGAHIGKIVLQVD